MASSSGVARLTIDKLATKLRAGERITLYDANTRERYLQGHIPGAKWIDASNVRAEELPEDRNAFVVVYCLDENGTSSQRAAQAAVKLGYTHVALMPAGILGWEKAGRTTRAKED